MKNKTKVNIEVFEIIPNSIKQTTLTTSPRRIPFTSPLSPDIEKNAPTNIASIFISKFTGLITTLGILKIVIISPNKQIVKSVKIKDIIVPFSNALYVFCKIKTPDKIFYVGG